MAFVLKQQIKNKIVKTYLHRISNMKIIVIQTSLYSMISKSALDFLDPANLGMATAAGAGHVVAVHFPAPTIPISASMAVM